MTVPPRKMLLSRDRTCSFSQWWLNNRDFFGQQDDSTAEVKTEVSWSAGFTRTACFMRLSSLHLIWLVVYLPLWKRLEFVNWDDYPQYFWKNEIHVVPNHQTVIILFKATGVPSQLMGGSVGVGWIGWSHTSKKANRRWDAWWSTQKTMVTQLATFMGFKCRCHEI